MSNKYRTNKTTNYSHTMATAATMTRAVCDRRHSLHRMTVVVTFVACLLALAHGSKYETQLKLLVNDEDLMLQQERNHAAAAMQQAHSSPHHPEGAYNGDEHEHNYGTYRSELKRLSYETIHRILRDENEPVVRREDSDLRYYQKRSYEPLNAHAIEKRSASESAKRVVSVDLSQKSLREFSAASVKITEDPASVTSIDLHDNILNHVDLKGFDSLISLNLTNNSLTDLPDLTDLPHFATLVMNANRVRDVRPQINYHLNALHLSGNTILNLSTVQLSMLNALETLDLSCNAVSSLETSFFPQRMHNLKHLNLAHNRLGSIYRETFYNLLSLNTLLLAHNNISEIDYETFLALPNLQNLDLSYNNLKGESIRALQGIPDLVRLSIAYNPEVGALMQEFVASWSLKELDASGTGLCQIPAALAQSVRILKLTDNWLKVISCGDLDSYPLLQYLDLSRSRIEDIEDDALGRLEILETLFLDHNRLRKVPLSLPTSLVHLFLHNNQIQDVQQQMFDSLNNLQTLDLSGNKLLYLPALPLPKLLTLNLQAAELKGLSQSIVHTMPQLRDLWLDDNPIKCSDLLGIAEWASPCRPPERSTLEIDDNAADASDGGEGRRHGGELGQQPSGMPRQSGGKIDLKRNFLRMHNFYEKFTPENSSACDALRQQHEPGLAELQRQQLRQRQMMAAPPGCVREFNDHVAPKTTEPPIGAPLTEVISSTNPTIMLMVKNVSTEAMTAAPITTTQTPIGSKAAASSSITRPLTPETASTDGAAMQNQHLSAADNEINLSKSFTANKQTMLMGPSSGASQQQSTAVVADGSLNAKLSGQPASRTTKQQDGKLVEKQREQKILQTPPQQQTLQKLQQWLLMKSPENELSEMPPTSRPTATDIAATATSISSLDSGMKLSTGPDDHGDTGETTNFILKPTALVPNASTLPRAAASTLKADSNADAFRGLLSKKWLKLTKPRWTIVSPIRVATAAAPAATVPAPTTANVISETPTTGQRLPSEAMPNAQTEANLAAVTVSGRRHSEETTTLGDATTTTTATTTTPAPQPHHHNAMELHIKDRHLIGTPLLMHKGEHILVEAKLLPNFGGGGVGTRDGERVAPTTKAEHLAAVPAAIAPVTTSASLTTTITASIQRHEHERLKGNDINVLAQSQQQDQQRPRDDHEHAAVTTQTMKAVTNEAATSPKHRAKDVKVAGEAKQHTKKPSLVMKKMTITKMHNGQPQQTQQDQQAQQQQPHHSLNTPRGQVGLTAHELAAQTTASDSKTATTMHRHQEAHPHGSINKPRMPDTLMGSMKIPIRDHISNSLHQEHDREAPSKTEHLLDVRSTEESSGHPGLVFLLSFSLFVVLLVGLMHVYRCDVPWRRHLNAHHHQRPHRHTLTAEDDSHSFLSYQQHHQPAAAMQQWHHSLREQKPFQSPLHNLQVRELRPISAVDDRHHQRGLQPIGLYNGGGNVAIAMPPGSGESTPSGHSSPGSRSSSGSEHLDSNEAFYIEMTADSSQHAIHGDVLPMELLSSVSASAVPSRQMTENESFLFNTRDCDKDGQPQDPDSAAITGATTPKRSTMSARKFALW